MSATTTQTVAVKTAQTVSGETWFTKQALKFESGRFGWMSLMLTVQSCLGSVAALYILKNDSVVMLAIGIIMTMACNAVLIAQGPAKWCLRIFYASIFVNTVLILINLFS